MHNLRQYTVPLQRYMALMDLQVIDCSLEFMFSSRECVQRFVWLVFFNWWLMYLNLAGKEREIVL